MARVAVDRIIAAGFMSPTAGRRRGNINLRTNICQTCGSHDHTTSGCTKRDDQTLGTRTPVHNGEYDGPLTVRTIPPGWSFLDRYAGLKLARIEAGQRWYAPDATLYIVDRVVGQLIQLERSNCTYRKCRVRSAVLRARWFYAGAGQKPTVRRKLAARG
jgi:hypothetical protein